MSPETRGVVSPSQILANARATSAVKRVADVIGRQIESDGVPAAKVRLGYVNTYYPATHTVDAIIGDLVTTIPNVPVLQGVLPITGQAALFAQVTRNGQTEYTLLGPLGGSVTSGNAGPGIVRIRKTTDQGILNSSVSQSDNEMKFYAQANRSYIYEIMCIVVKTGSETASDFKLGWLMPTGATWSGGGPGPISSMAASSNAGETTGAGANWRAGVNQTGTYAYGVDADPGGGTSYGIIVMAHGTIKMSSTPGVCTVIWGQQTAGGGGITTTVKSGSYVKVDITSELVP